jgi:hypothetical protein
MKYAVTVTNLKGKDMYRRIVGVMFVAILLLGIVLPFLISTASDTGVALGILLTAICIYFLPNAIEFIKGDKKK